MQAEESLRQTDWKEHKPKLTQLVVGVVQMVYDYLCYCVVLQMWSDWAQESCCPKVYSLSCVRRDCQLEAFDNWDQNDSEKKSCQSHSSWHARGLRDALMGALKWGGGTWNILEPEPGGFWFLCNLIRSRSCRVRLGFWDLILEFPENLIN